LNDASRDKETRDGKHKGKDMTKGNRMVTKARMHKSERQQEKTFSGEREVKEKQKDKIN